MTPIYDFTITYMVTIDGNYFIRSLGKHWQDTNIHGITNMALAVLDMTEI